MTFSEFESFTNNLYALLGGGTGSAAYVEVVKKMISLLDDADADNVLGTQGWKYQAGLED